MGEDFREFWSELTKEQRIMLIGGLILVYLISFLFSSYLGGFIGTMGGISKIDHSFMWYGIHDYFMLSTIIALAIYFLFIVLIFKKNYRNFVFQSYSNGMHVMKDGTHGSARFMTTAERRQVYEVTDISNTKSHVFGQESEGGERVVAWKRPQSGAPGTQNVLVMAASGLGKSYTIGRTNLLQTIKRGDSFVCSDPSGELYRSLAGYCRKKGVDVHVLNLKEPVYSEFWNCLEETIDPATERLDSTRLNDFASIFMENSGEQKKDFWYTSALNLVKAVIGYVAYEKEKEIAERFAELYLQIKGGVEDEVSDKMLNSMVSFPWCRDQIINAAKQRGLNIEDTKKLLHEIQHDIPKVKFTIKEVFESLLHFGDIEEGMKKIPQWHPAKYAYLMYQTSDNENVRQSALQGAQLRFGLFTDNNVQELLSHDGMHISDINKKQSAYFICMSDKTNTLKPITSLFFSFLFKDLQDNWDRAQDEVGEGNKNPCKETTIMLDEFFSIGVIGGNPETFGTYMSNSRKRELHIYIIIQGYSQLEALYGPEIKNVIQGQCSTLVYLGGNDPDTVEFISKFAGGDATVLSERHAEGANVIGNRLGRTTQTTTTNRMLITEDEARRFKQVLVVKQGEYPTKIKQFPWTEHPAYQECNSVDIHKEIEPIQQRVERLDSRKYSDRDTYVYKILKKKTDALLNGGNIDSVTEDTVEAVSSAKKDSFNNREVNKAEVSVSKENNNNSSFGYSNLAQDGVLDPSKMTRSVGPKNSRNKRENKSALND